jgi:transposase
VDTAIGARHAPSEVSDLVKKRRSFTKEFKVQSVRLVIDQGRTIADVARSLGVGEGVLSQWKKNYAALASDAFPGNGKRTPHDDEVWQLKKKLSRAEQERDILKKALAYFATDPK